MKVKARDLLAPMSWGLPCAYTCTDENGTGNREGINRETLHKVALSENEFDVAVLL